MYGLPRPWYFPLQRSYWSGSGRMETWDWPWCGGSTTRLSVMEEDQACAMDQRRTGTTEIQMFIDTVSWNIATSFFIAPLIESVKKTLFFNVRDKYRQLPLSLKNVHLKQSKWVWCTVKNVLLPPCSRLLWLPLIAFRAQKSFTHCKLCILHSKPYINYHEMLIIHFHSFFLLKLLLPLLALALLAESYHFSTFKLMLLSDITCPLLPPCLLEATVGRQGGN